MLLPTFRAAATEFIANEIHRAASIIIDIADSFAGGARAVDDQTADVDPRELAATVMKKSPVAPVQVKDRRKPLIKLPGQGK